MDKFTDDSDNLKTADSEFLPLLSHHFKFCLVFQN